MHPHVQTVQDARTADGIAHAVFPITYHELVGITAGKPAEVA